MPIYEYKCLICGENFELRRQIDDSDGEIKCPKCGTEYPQRVFSLFATSFMGEACGPDGST